MKLHVLLISLLTAQLGLCQSIENDDTSLEATSNLRAMIEKPFFTSVEINSTSTVNAIQQLCDLIGEKQSVKNEKKIRFILEGAPNVNFSSSLTAKMLGGPELLQKFCKHYKLKMQFDQGSIYLFPDTSHPSYTEAKERLLDTPLSSVNISSEFLPHALRRLLKPHGISFSLVHPKQSDPSKPNPILLNNYRIGIYKKENTNLYKVLTELAEINNSNLWVSPHGISFIPKNSKFITKIKSSRVKE